MSAAPDAVGILGGTGPQGRGLAIRLAQAGRTVTIGSRDPDRAAKTAAALVEEHDLDPRLVDGAGNDVAAAAPIVIVAVPFEGLEATLPPLSDVLRGRGAVVISCVNHLAFDGDGPRPVPVEVGSAAERVAELLPDVRVVAAFHHVAAGRLRDATAALDMDVLVLGDDDDACAVAVGLADAIPGARGVRAGPLRLARPVEEFTAVVLAVNRRYRVTAGTRLTGLDGVDAQ